MQLTQCGKKLLSYYYLQTRPQFVYFLNVRVVGTIFGVQAIDSCLVFLLVEIFFIFFYFKIHYCEVVKPEKSALGIKGKCSAWNYFGFAVWD